MSLFGLKKYLTFLKNNYIKILIIMLILMAMSFAVYFIAFKTGKFQLLNKSELENILSSYGTISSMFFICLYLAKTFFVILPSSILVIIGGRLFGPLYGFIYSMGGMLMSATLAFYVGRYAGRDFIEKLAGKRVGYVNDKVESYGIRVIATMRLAFVIPFDVLSFGAGLTKMKYRDFITGTFLGIVAETFCLNYLGEKMQNVGSSGFIFSVVMLIIVTFSPMIYSKLKKMKTNSLTQRDISILSLKKDMSKQVNEACKEN